MVVMIDRSHPGVSKHVMDVVRAHTSAAAVAVRAMMGTFGKSLRSELNLRYAGRKSWPHELMQCACRNARVLNGRGRLMSDHNLII
jgi:hypothetical protein